MKIINIILLLLFFYPNGPELANATNLFGRFISTLFGNEKPKAIADIFVTEMREKIAKLENSLRNEMPMEMLKKCQTHIQIAILKFELTIHGKLEHITAITELINDPRAQKNPKYHEENEQLSHDSDTVMQEIRRLDSLKWVYRRASSALNEACELHVDNNRLELFEPRYSNALIHFIAEGANFCTRLKMGKNVNYPDVKEENGYNFFEELIEEIADSENANDIVRKMEFSLNKKEQKKDYDSIMGPRGALRKSGILMRMGQIGTDGIIEILGEQIGKHKGIFKKKYSETLYKVSNKKTKAAFEVRLMFSDSLKKRPSSEQKLLALHIHAIQQ